MKSKLDATEFRNKIKSNTVIGNPKLKFFSPFWLFKIFEGFSKPFYGNFDDSTFRLTINSTVSPTFYTIIGKYKTTNRTLNISYSIEPTHKFSSIWTKYFPVVAFLLVNSVMISNGTPAEVYIVFNLFLVLIMFLSKRGPKKERKNLERKFNEIFEII
ncbi:hypothetical protein BC749_101103 [Flavobacterium araucananum]|uniref:Uncharacterized protein n=1 Tax=Flavobacterium araucananum TaxID=946678 RepID=A0A227PE41_9FLAO|nr:hypothetical protein [Flavobacterium araucananum]OXG07773.1 hypothetical protein B0A64_07940 [Flavobacterium araucananum]PWK02045.1 hypothetical protein BC749_101103 [Flavobacterium araucananum]